MFGAAPALAGTYLMLEGLPSPNTEPVAHAHEFRLLGASLPGMAGAAGLVSLASPVAQFSGAPGLTITLAPGQNCAQLERAAASHRSFPAATLSLTRLVSGREQTYLTFKLRAVQLQPLQRAKAGVDDTTAISIRYQRVESDAGAPPRPPPSDGWNIIKSPIS